MYLERVISYAESIGFKIKIDNNPSEEKIKRIKASINKREELERLVIEINKIK